MKKSFAVFLTIAVFISLAACSGNIESSNESVESTNQSAISSESASHSVISSSELNADVSDNGYIIPSEELESISDIESNQIADTLITSGYTEEHASDIQTVLNTVGIDSVEIQNMTGMPESGLNSVTCYPNGYTDENRRLYFTTEDGVIFYAGFLDEDLYDSDNGGYLMDYNDVHVPETEITSEVATTLKTLAEEAVKSCLNYPDSANFGQLDWSYGRSDEHYQVRGIVTASNAFGVSNEVHFSVWFVATDSGYDLEGVTLNGTRVK